MDRFFITSVQITGDLSDLLHWLCLHYLVPCRDTASLRPLMQCSSLHLVSHKPHAVLLLHWQPIRDVSGAQGQSRTGFNVWCIHWGGKKSSTQHSFEYRDVLVGNTMWPTATLHHSLSKQQDQGNLSKHECHECCFLHRSSIPFAVTIPVSVRHRDTSSSKAV